MKIKPPNVVFAITLNEVIAFTDVNRQTLEMIIEDLENNLILSYDSINDIGELELFDYDLIEVGEYYMTNGIVIPVLNGYRFWGWSCSFDFNEGGECKSRCNYNVLWTATIPKNSEKRDCSEKPVSYKRLGSMNEIDDEPWID